MRYKVNARCTQCGTAYSYWNDDSARLKQCPNAGIYHRRGDEGLRKPCLDNDGLTERDIMSMSREELLRRFGPPEAR